MTKQKSKNLVVSDSSIAKQMTDEEQRLAEVFKAGLTRALSLPRFKERTFDESAHTLGAFMDVCKTDHFNAAVKAIEDITAVRTSDDPDKCLNMALQQFEALHPQSYLESLLVGQMLQVNAAITKCMGLAFLKDQTAYGKEINANLAIKLQRTFVAQIEALQKLRGKGGQKVTVEHVHVHEGGQAIVGNVSHAPGGGGKNEN